MVVYDHATWHVAYQSRQALPMTEAMQLCILLIQFHFSRAHELSTVAFSPVFLLPSWSFGSFEYYFEPYLADVLFQQMLSISRAIFILLTMGTKSFTSIDSVCTKIPCDRLPYDLHLPIGLPPPMLGSVLQNPLRTMGPIWKMKLMYHSATTAISEGLFFLSTLLEARSEDYRYPWHYVLTTGSLTEDIDKFIHPPYFYRYNESYRILNHSSKVPQEETHLRHHIGLSSIFELSNAEQIVPLEDTAAEITRTTMSQGLFDVISIIVHERSRRAQLVQHSSPVTNPLTHSNQDDHVPSPIPTLYEVISSDSSLSPDSPLTTDVDTPDELSDDEEVCIVMYARNSSEELEITEAAISIDYGLRSSLFLVDNKSDSLVDSSSRSSTQSPEVIDLTYELSYPSDIITINSNQTIYADDSEEDEIIDFTIEAE